MTGSVSQMHQTNMTMGLYLVGPAAAKWAVYAGGAVATETMLLLLS